MRISVVMPVWNSSATIGNAIASIMNQTISDWELIIVDDGSEDKHQLQTVLDKFKDERIRVVHLKDNLGIANARNIGCGYAKAPYITHQDADDLSLPDRLEKALDNIGDADVLVHGIYVNMWEPTRGTISRGYRKVEAIDPIRLRKEQYISGVPIFKKSLWEKKPFREETRYSYDWMMHLDWLQAGAKYKMLDIGLYEYVRHENSASVRFEKDGRRQDSFKKIQEIIQHEM